jgi:hypothetical protein
MTEVVQPTDKLMLQQNLRLQHSPQLESTGDFVFDTASAGATDSTTYQGRLGLTHRLYQNLTSAIDLHGDTTTGRGGGSTLTTSRAGVGLSEQYTKRFSPDLNVALGYGARFDHEDRHASGALLNVVNESHTLTDGVLTFLGQPLITGPITVTDPNENPYTEGLDYQLIPHGQLTEIRRLNGGRIANGGLVYVDYTANLQPSATFWAIGHTGTFRLDFFRNHFGLYGRWLSLDYTGAKQLLLRTEDDKVIGLDTTWEWFRASAEYENMDSNLAPYDRVRLVQSFQFQPADEALLGVDFDENWATFRDTNIHDSSYSLITRYQQRFSPHLLWNAEGGLRLERGSNATFDHTTGTARTSLDWTIAKLTLKLGYEYNSDSHRTDRYQRHYCFLRARRRF